MKQTTTLRYEFVKSVPEKLADGILYVSMDYATAIHKCCCGCGNEVVTPISPTDWQLTYDGISISLFPSIGNWSFDCKSHYWIERNSVRWAGRLSTKQIEAGRTHDRQVKGRYYGIGEKHRQTGKVVDAVTGIRGKSREGFWSWLRKWWSR